jgi:hypothetical protein
MRSIHLNRFTPAYLIELKISTDPNRHDDDVADPNHIRGAQHKQGVRHLRVADKRDRHKLGQQKQVVE